MIHAKQYGSSGPHLLIIHGLFGNADNWHSIAQSLAENFTVYCIDLPNHGKSDGMNEATYPNMAQAVLDWAASNTISRCYLMGHSMGGKVAMQMVSMAQNVTIEKLIVVDIAPVDYAPSHTDILAGLKALDRTVIMTRRDADILLSQYETNTTVRQFLLKNLIQGEHGYTLALSVNNIEHSYAAILQKPPIDHAVTTPTLFIKGEKSDYIMTHHQDAITTLFPKASFKLITGAGHWLHAEKPRPFTSLVKRFLL
ncbi:alpha/beta fold hydrolase [Marinomonas sp. IMCC 4694]|uniref:alpha/beta fold hydrolase n=1 Tax=Marinomonas sp. IMCC 4694 TaxID=2605432 RepID=UPI0011E7FF3E|nr:alpha/beta fold hydrolase [Marinomonas sp. IMCC 4694]TYL48283.1 alpha/beta fold hydrolase [Marinomonas sp. IMCC 4694]